MAPLLTRLGQAFGFGSPVASDAGGSGPFTATGGNNNSGNGTEPGNGWKYHSFTSPGNFVVSAGTKTVQVFMLGGGGGGGGSGPGGQRYGGGGGGSGGLIYDECPSLGSGTYAVQVGEGGGGAPVSPDANGANAAYQGENGQPSVVNSIDSGSPLIAYGGGSGAYDYGPYGGYGGDGGCGGGSGASNRPEGGRGNFQTGGGGYPRNTYEPGPETALPNSSGGSLRTPTGVGVQGHDGSGNGGGGGGTSQAGGDNGKQGTGGGQGASGGDGTTFSAFTGNLIGVPALNPLSGVWGGGGGGGTYNGGPGQGPGGDGGGGSAGPYPEGHGVPGTANSGGGGGGSTGDGNASPGGTGGDGIVVIRYET